MAMIALPARRWFAPFFDRTSFGKEAATLVLGMMRLEIVRTQWVQR